MRVHPIILAGEVDQHYSLTPAGLMATDSDPAQAINNAGELKNILYPARRPRASRGTPMHYSGYRLLHTPLCFQSPNLTVQKPTYHYGSSSRAGGLPSLEYRTASVGSLDS